jgi:hypothetical protein
MARFTLPRSRSTSTTVAIAFAALLLPACGKAACAAPQGPDAPVPDSEPRASLKVRVDLARKGGCDEAFELALYQHRGVDLVTWEGDPGAQAKCEGRVGTIRFLPKRITRPALLERVKQASVTVTVLEG